MIVSMRHTIKSHGILIWDSFRSRFFSRTCIHIILSLSSRRQHLFLTTSQQHIRALIHSPKRSQVCGEECWSHRIWRKSKSAYHSASGTCTARTKYWAHRVMRVVNMRISKLWDFRQLPSEVRRDDGCAKYCICIFHRLCGLSSAPRRFDEKKKWW